MRPGVAGIRGIANRFNPRIRKGCDISCKLDRLTNVRFNPRIRKGCDRSRQPQHAGI